MRFRGQEAAEEAAAEDTMEEEAAAEDADSRASLVTPLALLATSEGSCM
jgi:hypothetical protein